MEEVATNKIKLEERRNKTRHFIETGTLVAKAGLDKLPLNALYGGLLYLQDELAMNPNIQSAWVVKGENKLRIEQKKSYPVIIKFSSTPSHTVRDQIRALGLQFDSKKLEWRGTVEDLPVLQKLIKEQDYKLLTE